MTARIAPQLGGKPLIPYLLSKSNSPRLFSPSENYPVLQGDGSTYTAGPGGSARRHDYGGMSPIVWHDGATGLNLVQHTGLTRSAGQIQSTYPTGEAGHYERIGTRWRVAYNTGEALTASACRCQILSWPLPPGRMLFDMTVQFGDATDNWTLTTNGVSPCLFWQLKGNTTPQPVYQLNVDTDSADATKLELYLNYKALGSSGSVTRLATLRGLQRHTPINIIVDGLFTYETDGWIEWRVNGAQIYQDDSIATLQSDTVTYYHAHCGIYMWNDLVPASAPTRVTWWDRHRVITP